MYETMAMDERGLLTCREVARVVGASSSSVQRWIDAGHLRAFRTPGGHRRVTRSEVDRFMLAHGLLSRGSPERDSRRVLVVDDEERVRQLVVRILERMELDLVVDTASDGFVAARKLTSFAPHLMVLDLKMPGLNGLEVCRYIKRDPATAYVEVIVLSGYLTKEVERELRACGVRACLRKPFDPDRLREEVRVALGPVGARREAAERH